jgi:ABC-2 type transport system permease protein
VTAVDLHEKYPGVEEIRGPSAIGGEPRRFLRLTWTLAVLEFRLKFFGSVLGYLWQLARPLMLFGVLYGVFTEFVRLGNGVRYYPVVLLSGIVLHTFFAEATAGAVPSALARENLVRKIQFPRLVIPMAVVLTALMNFILNFGAVIVFMVISGVELHWSALQLIPLVALLATFCSGLAMALSALFVRYRDVSPIWEVMLPLTFYGSPVIYPIETIPRPELQQLVMCNPVATIIQQVRHAVIDPTAPSAAEAIGGGARLLIPAAILILTVLIGYAIFNRAAPNIAEEL